MTNFGLFSKIEQNSLFEELFLKKKNKALKMIFLKKVEQKSKIILESRIQLFS